MSKRYLPFFHPGEQLREEFMKPLGISASKLAKEIDVPVHRVRRLITERHTVTGETALRLARYFNTTPYFWLNMQRDYDLEQAELEMGAAIAATVRPWMA